MGGDGLYLATSLGSLGQLRYKLRDYPRAEALFRHALAIREQALGPDDQGLVQSINNLAALHYARGELAEAQQLFRRALTISEANLGFSHPDLTVGLNNLAKLYIRTRDFHAAAPLLVRLVGIRADLQGRQHPETASVILMLARVRFALRETREAELLCREALGMQEEVLPSDDPALAATRTLLAEIVAARPASTRDLQDGASTGDVVVAAPPAKLQEPDPPQATPEPQTVAESREAVVEPEPAAPDRKPAAYESPPVSSEPATLPDIQILTSAGDSLGGRPVPPIAAASDLHLLSSAESVAPHIEEHNYVAPPAIQSSSNEADGWTLDPRDVSDGSAGITPMHAPHVLPAASPATHIPEEEATGEEDPDMLEQHVSAVVERAEALGDEWSDDPMEDAYTSLSSRGRQARRAMRPWPHHESRAKNAAIAATVALLLLAAGWFAFLRDDAEASATTPPAVEAPSAYERPVESALPVPAPLPPAKTADAAEAIVEPTGGLNRGVPTEAERVRMGVAAPGYSAEPEPFITSGDPLDPPPLPNVRVNLDPLSRSIARTKARVDSLGRAIPEEPIQFQRP